MTVSSSCIFSPSHTWSIECCIWKSHKNNTGLLHASCSISITTSRPLKWSHHHTKGKKNIDSKRKLHHSSVPISVITPFRTLSGDSCLIIHVVCSGYWEKDTQQTKSRKLWWWWWCREQRRCIEHLKLSAFRRLWLEVAHRLYWAQVQFHSWACV